MNLIVAKHSNYLVLTLVLVVLSLDAQCDLNHDIGYTQLQAELNLQGLSLPNGRGVNVLMAEACGNSVDDDNNPSTPPACVAWLPDPSSAEFQDKVINDISGSTSGLFSSHATGVAALFFGNARSVAHGIKTIDAYLASHWINSGYLQVGQSSLLPGASSNRIANHSWVGSIGSDPNSQPFNGDVLRRVDWLIDRDEFIHIVGLTNGSPNQALLGGAFNVITVGRTDGNHGQGSPAVDSIYRAGRTRPDIVAPLSTTSSATPVVSALTALLIEEGHNDQLLSTDPESMKTINRVGDTINNAERSEVIKAVLMAGSQRVTLNDDDINIVDYRLQDRNQTDNGLDSRFGAGQVNIANSYRILKAGEQNSAEDSIDSIVDIESLGFDYDPSFGGDSSNFSASYRFSTDSDNESFYVSLVWNIRIENGRNGGFDGMATLYNLDLYLYDVTENSTLVATSDSTNENTENLWIGLDRNREYLLQVVSNSPRGVFDWDYAIAWRMEKDTDHDGVTDSRDNCILINNMDQRDIDADGFGNACDPDLNNDGVVNFLDLDILRSYFFGRNKAADFDGDGYVNFGDLDIMKKFFFTSPGPSGLEL